jgi:hypothetical protein
LLGRLDLVDGGWKRLALGFLEERVLRGACGQVVNERHFRLSNAPSSRPVVPQRTAPSALRTLTVGSLLLVAFLGGRWTVPADLASRTDSTSNIIAVDSPAPDLIGDDATASQPHRGDTTDRPTQPASPQTWVNFQLPGSDEPISVPVYRASAESVAPGPTVSPVLSPEEREYLRRAGYVVDSEQRLLEIDDGRGESIVVPWETVHLRLARY